MKSKKAQGLPITTIVIVIIALITLVLIVLFATGTLGNLFQRTTSLAEATETDIIAAQTKCSNLCLTAKASSTRDEFKNSAYCKRKIPLDTDGDGVITDEPTPIGNEATGIRCIADRDELKCCWEDPIFEDCRTTIGGVGVGGFSTCRI